MSLLKAFASGLVGACTLTLLNETARRFVKNAPRLEILGERSIAYPLMAAGKRPPAGTNLYRISLAGDLFTNALYFGLIGLDSPKNSFRNGAFLGLAAGVGSVVLPEPLGLGKEPTARTKETETMTVAWYLAGGLAAAAVYQYLSDEN